MIILITWILGSIISTILSVKLLRLDKRIKYRSSSDIKEDFMIMIILSIVGSWIFALLVGFSCVFNKYEKEIANYIKGELNEKQ